MPTIYDEMLPRREATPLTEIICLIIAGVLSVAAVVAFGIVRVAEWTTSHCRKIATEPQNVPVSARTGVNLHTGMGGCSDCSQEGISTQADVARMWQKNEESFEAGP